MVFSDLSGPANSLESSSSSKKIGLESCRNTDQLHCLQEDLAHEADDAGATSTLLAFASGPEGKHFDRKVAKVPRISSSGFLKRLPHIPKLETSMSLAEAVEEKPAFDKLGPRLIKCPTAESRQQKQKNFLISKRGDRRNSRVHLKAKNDAYSSKASLLSFSPASVANSIYGTYGLKADMHDITKLIDDVPLNELLDGSCKCPSLGKEKGKKPVHMNENVLDSVRKAFNVLQRQVLSQVKQCDEIDVPSSQNIPSLLSTSNLCVPSSMDGEEEDSLAANLPVGAKAHQSVDNVEVPSIETIESQQLFQPKDILLRVDLLPPKDLDSLLQDAAKPALSSRCDDAPHSGKAACLQVNLPSFSWSHSHNGHSKSSTDLAKVSHRSTCQGKWVRIGGRASLQGGSPDWFLPDLDSLTFNHTLVPSGSVKYVLPETRNDSSQFLSPPAYEQGSSLTDASKASWSLPAPPSPRCLVAAQTLIDMANKSLKPPTSSGILKWPKQPSQKSVKARKSKSIEQHSDDLALKGKPEMMLNDPHRFIDRFNVPKNSKLPLPIPDKKNGGFVPSNATHSGPSSCWSAPRSNRSSPIRTVMREHPAFDGNHKQFSSSSSKRPILGPPPPPPPRFLDSRTSNHNQHKIRKVGQIDWNRSRS